MYPRDLTDPLGPGSLPWEAAERYTDSIRRGDRRLADMRKAYLIRVLRERRVTERDIAGWVLAAELRAKELDDEGAEFYGSDGYTSLPYKPRR